MMELKRGIFTKARKLLLKSLKILPRSSTYNALANLENRSGGIEKRQEILREIHREAIRKKWF